MTPRTGHCMYYYLFGPPYFYLVRYSPASLRTCSCKRISMLQKCPQKGAGWASEQGELWMTWDCVENASPSLSLYFTLSAPIPIQSLGKCVTSDVREAGHLLGLGRETDRERRDWRLIEESTYFSLLSPSNTVGLYRRKSSQFPLSPCIFALQFKWHYVLLGTHWLSLWLSLLLSTK